VWFGQVVGLSSVVEWWCLNLLGADQAIKPNCFGSRMMRVSLWVGVLTVSILDLDTILLFHKNGNTFLTVELAVTNKKI